MADLSAANVTVLASWSTGNANGRRNKVKRVKWTGTTAGGATDKLLASAFGFRVILKSSSVLLDSSTKKIYPSVPSADGTILFLSNPAEATDANRANVANVATSTDFAYVTLEGY
jgi:hypothetical protein